MMETLLEEPKNVVIDLQDSYSKHSSIWGKLKEHREMVRLYIKVKYC